MDVLSGSMPSLFLGVVVPLSTLAAVAIACGDNRQATHKKKKKTMNAPPAKKGSRKHGNVSSSKKHRSHSGKSGSVSSSKVSSSKDKHESKKHRSKQDSKKLKTTRDTSKKAVSESSAVHKKSKPNVISKKNVSIASGKPLSAEPLKSVTYEDGSKPLSVKGTQSSTQKEQSRRQPPIDMHLEPNQLSFSTVGGLQQVNVHNKDANGQRYAIKAKCSDNLLYRVNPVYAIVEPGKSVSLNVYRNGTPNEHIKMVDKLVVAVAKVPKEENEPHHAFEDPSVKHPMMAIPLLVSSINARDVVGPCMCVKAEC